MIMRQRVSRLRLCSPAYATGLFCLALSFLVLLPACDRLPFQPREADAGSYVLDARATSIRSYPGGGGVFTIFMEPGADFRGDVRLSVIADRDLHCTFSLPLLYNRNRTTDLHIAPESGSPVTPRTIVVRAEHAGAIKTLTLNVTMYDWSHSVPGEEIALLRRYLDWIRMAHPKAGTVEIVPSRRYLTYPEILIVEHWTFLSPLYELRLCRHIMVPPHDWSMMLLRQVGHREPSLAARLDSGSGEIREIPVSEYPILFGY
jgi:hypothetical protein